MKNVRVVGMWLSLSLVGVAVTPTTAGAKEPAAKEAPAPTGPTRVDKAPVLTPRGLRWGQKPKQVFKVYDKAIEHDFLPQFKNAQPGVQMERVEEEVRQAQEAFRLSYTKLDAPPSALDATSFEGEYTYYNKEAFMQIKRQGKSRHLFFIRGKLWKTIDVYPLGNGSKWGDTYGDAVARVDKILKKEGRRVAEEGRRAVADWTDGTTHVQVVDWASGEVAVIYIDQRTENRLDELRKNQGPEQHDIDPEVKGVLRNEGKAPKAEPPPEGSD